MRTKVVGSLILALLVASTAAAQGRQNRGAALRQDIIAQLNDAEKKLIALAEATPQDKFAWRPASGVRSTSEVFMHVALANVLIPGLVGIKDTTLRVTQEMERSVTDKAQIVDMLKKSFAVARGAVTGVPQMEMDSTVSFFGTPMSKRSVLLLLATHAHEHLGQSIAYARMNGVVPPWSRAGG